MGQTPLPLTCNQALCSISVLHIATYYKMVDQTGKTFESYLVSVEKEIFYEMLSNILTFSLRCSDSSIKILKRAYKKLMKRKVVKNIAMSYDMTFIIRIK